MQKLIRSMLVTAVAATALSGAIQTSAAEALAKGDADKVLAAMRQARPDIPFTEVFASPIKGVYRVPVGNQSLYVSADGKHFIAGDLLEVTASGFVDPMEAERALARAELVKSIDASTQIIYSPKGETRAHINVFTDIDCGYCRKLHRQMDEMNAQGIEVRYLAFPRAGLQSESYDKIATAWCSDNPQKALTTLKNREPLDMAVCNGNPVAEHLELGSKLGVTGTPAMVLEDGRLIPGYMPTADLLNTLGLEPIDSKLADAASNSG